MAVSKHIRNYVNEMKNEILGIMEKKMNELRIDVGMKMKDCRCEMISKVREECQSFCSEQTSMLKEVSAVLQ